MRDAFLVSESIAEAAVIVEMALTGRLAKALSSTLRILILRSRCILMEVCFQTRPTL